MTDWIEGLAQVSNNSESYVLLTVLETKGSSPRDTGTKMLVTKNSIFDTIGGGALEHESIQIARGLLEEGKCLQLTRSFNLGKDLKQCCGGVVDIFFEVFSVNNFNIAIFGAGHIGKSLVKILEDVDCQLIWFDSRVEQFPSKTSSHIKHIIMSEPEISVDACEKNTYFLVMTHDHALDQQLCEAILSRGDSRYCGLIGSRTKGLKFRQRLLKKGFNEQELIKLSCPVGLKSMYSKKPMEIAISITAELLRCRDKHANIYQSKHSEIININKVI